MLTNIFDCPVRVKAFRDGPGGSLLEGFSEELCQAGYAKITARGHIRAAEHLLYWTDREGLPIVGFNEKVLEHFDRHLDRCQCPRYGHVYRLHLLNGARLFLGHLRGAGVITASVADPPHQDPVLFTAFCQWMRQQRGTCELTLYNYGLSIRDLLKRLGEDPGKFDAQSLRQFVLDKSQQSGWATAKKCTTALRMFLRFLIAEGKCAAGLDAAIPVLAHWRLSSLPRYLQPEEVERVITSCDPTSPVGRRDRAILLLLARLGLRAGDIVQLRLGDIDWEGAGVHVCGKGHRQTRLPLTQEVGHAVAAYLQDGRPRTDPMYSLSAPALLFAPSVLIVPSRSSSHRRCAEPVSLARAGVPPTFFVIPWPPPCYGKGHRCRTSRSSFGTVPSRPRRSTPR